MRQLNFAIIFLSFLYQGCTQTPKNEIKVADHLQCPESYREIALSKANWENEYKQYSKVIFKEKQNLIFMSPDVARDSKITHASLVLSKFNIESENFDLIVDYKNDTALRIVNPNPWEVFWLFFNYVPGPEVTKTTNYIIAKTNGIELGRAAQEIDQAYLKTDERFKASFNKWHRLRVQQQNGLAKFYFNDTYVFEVSSSVLFTAHGKVGLYSEDAAVIVKRVCLNIDAKLRY